MSALKRQPLDDLVDRIVKVQGQPSRAAFLTRAVRGLFDLADKASPKWLLHAASAPSDYEVLLKALQVPGCVETDSSVPLMIRGFEERDKLLKARGGVLAAEAVAKHLHMSRQAVDKRRRAGTLVGLPIGRRGYAYPAWQFGHEGTVPGLERMLRALADHDPWMQSIFLLNPNSELGGVAPIDALVEGRVDEIERLAQAFGEQGSL